MRHRFTLEFESDDAIAGAVREAAIEAATDAGAEGATGHVVREVEDGDDWDRLPLLEK